MPEPIYRVGIPPYVEDQTLRDWFNQVYDALNGIPPFSIFSTSDGPNSSAITAQLGTFGIELGSAVTRVWINRFGLPSSWSAIL